jgi:hypothetical protein
MVESNTVSPTKWFVAVDGSDSSHNAFLLTLNNLKKETDIFTVAHVFNKSKTYLPFNMKADHVR